MFGLDLLDIKVKMSMWYVSWICESEVQVGTYKFESH